MSVRRVHCHNCESDPSKIEVCRKCQFAAYCDNECFREHQKDHELVCGEIAAEMWTRDNLRANVMGELASPAVKRQLREYLQKSGGEVPLDLKVQIGDDLMINGKVFQTYLKTVLLTKVGRARVADKIIGKGKRFRYLTSYRDDQKEEIREIIEDNPDLDREGWIMEALKGISRHDKSEGTRR